jgi:hypothetical protein
MTRFRIALLAVWSVSVLLVGCGVDDVSCPSVEGVYLPLYTPLQGTCGPITNPYRVRLEVGRNGASVMRVDMLSNANVTTETVMKGCSVRVTQSVEEHGTLTSKLDGDPIYIESENELSGQVSLTRYDANGALTCSGVYDARFTKGAVTIGAAAQ